MAERLPEGRYGGRAERGRVKTCEEGMLTALRGRYLEQSIVLGSAAR